MAETIKMFCIRMNILSHRNNIELFLPCNTAAMQTYIFVAFLNFRAKRIKEFRALEIDRKLSFISPTIG